jgi:hypothetical protein
MSPIGFLQGPVLERYPALLSMVTLMEFFGCIQVAVLGAAYDGTRFLDFRSITTDQLIIILYGVSLTSPSFTVKKNWIKSWRNDSWFLTTQGILVSAVNLVLQAWCIRKVGPFIVSLYSPVQTLVVALMAVLIQGDTLYMGM